MKTNDIGAVVRFRRREWVIVSKENSALKLRPLTGTTEEHIAVHRDILRLVESAIPEEHLEPAVFPLPSKDDISDAVGAELLWQAARLLLREGASPLRSLGHISIRPRAYQFVPLLMALRLDPVRLFIADDVGVGKTIEALLVVRELLDRGEIKRFAVLCPPYLCDQWLREIREKFNLDAVFIHSSTLARLERHLPAHKRAESVYGYYPFQVLSIDWVKSERNRSLFLQFCPELVVVDEVHGVAGGSRSRKQQQRHALLECIAADPRRHLIFLTATPHSGVEEAFRSLLALLKPEFGEWEIGTLGKEQRIELARHFVQRTRGDIEHSWEGAGCFPKRESEDKTYTLSEQYRRLFERVYNFCYEIVEAGREMEERKRRVRYWGVLTLLRCVMSSPAAAVAALEARMERSTLDTAEEEPDFGSFIFEATDQMTVDDIPTPPIEAAERRFSNSERRKLWELKKQAKKLLEAAADTKLARCVEIVNDLLEAGFHPIVWCRYVATADYVSAHLRNVLPSNVQVLGITGRLPEEERRAQIERLDATCTRVLVATDCLSEGINLQEKFNAVIHYDLPWNPNRLEQREGRVDRFGQTSKVVKALRFYGRDNPVDGTVIEVLLKKAEAIRKTLGVYVPVPQEGETVMEAVLSALFLRRKKQVSQKELFEMNEEVARLHQRWEIDAQRERTTRTRFAQHAIKPEEVQRELEAVDQVLGAPDAVRRFILNASQRLSIRLTPDSKYHSVFRVDLSDAALSNLPDMLRFEMQSIRSLSLPRGETIWRISFDSPTHEGAEFIGRNHRFVTALARFLFEEALEKKSAATAPRCGVIRTNSVQLLTVLFCTRVRYIVRIPQDGSTAQDLLSEEVQVYGYRHRGNETEWLPNDEALNLLTRAKPTSNIPLAEKCEIIKGVLTELGDWEANNTGRGWGKNSALLSEIRARIEQRATQLEQSHKRIRRAVHLKVRELTVAPLFPPDLLALLVLHPEVKP